MEYPNQDKFNFLRHELRRQVKQDRHATDSLDKLDFSGAPEAHSLINYIKFFNGNPVVVEILDIQTGAELYGRDPEDADNVDEDFVYPRDSDPIDDPAPLTHRDVLDRLDHQFDL